MTRTLRVTNELETSTLLRILRVEHGWKKRGWNPSKSLCIPLRREIGAVLEQRGLIKKLYKKGQQGYYCFTAEGRERAVRASKPSGEKE